MKLAWTMALTASFLLTAFLILRPVFGRMGAPTTPDTKGVAASTGNSDSWVAPVDTTGLFVTPPLFNTSGITNHQGIEDLILELTNRARSTKNLPPLAPEPTLTSIARGHSDDMLARGFFEHNNPDGEGSADRVAKHHRRLIGLSAENIWRRKSIGQAVPIDSVLAADIVTSWLNSPGHYFNIMRPEFTHLGVGVSRLNNEIRATQLFATARAYLDQDVPSEVSQGSPFSLASSAVSASDSDATDYDYWSPEQGLTVTNRVPVTQWINTVAPGSYKLRFYFPNDAGGSTIYMGPMVTVK